MAAELEIAANRLRTCRLELGASGSAEAMARQKAEAAELQRLRRENARLKAENEILHMGERLRAIGPSASRTLSSVASLDVV